MQLQSNLAYVSQQGPRTGFPAAGSGNHQRTALRPLVLLPSKAVLRQSRGNGDVCFFPKLAGLLGRPGSSRQLLSLPASSGPGLT